MRALGAAAIGLGLALAACAPEPGGGARMKVGTYRLSELPEGLEVRSIPDQLPWLARALGWLPGLRDAGAPRVVLSRQGVEERDFWGRARHWRGAVVRELSLRRVKIRVPEEKPGVRAMRWRVGLVGADGELLRRSFRFEKEAQARRFRTLAGRALGLPDGEA